MEGSGGCGGSFGAGFRDALGGLGGLGDLGERSVRDLGRTLRPGLVRCEAPLVQASVSRCGSHLGKTGIRSGSETGAKISIFVSKI